MDKREVTSLNACYHKEMIRRCNDQQEHTKCSKTTKGPTHNHKQTNACVKFQRNAKKKGGDAERKGEEEVKGSTEKMGAAAGLAEGETEDNRGVKMEIMMNMEVAVKLRRMGGGFHARTGLFYLLSCSCLAS